MNTVHKKTKYKDMCDVLKRTGPGRALLYYRGNLASARLKDADLDRFARLAFGLQMAGTAICTQRRDDEGLIAYEIRLHRRLKYSDIQEALVLNPMTKT